VDVVDFNTHTFYPVLRVYGHLCVSLQGFLKRFRDPIRVPKIENRVPRIR